MSWEFFLRRIGPETVFSTDAISEMGAYLAGRPSYRRRDGVWVIRASVESRDRMVREGRTEESSPPSVAVCMEPEQVVVGVYGPSDVNVEAAAFIEFCQTHWPCKLYDELGNVVELETFVRWSRDG